MMNELTLMEYTQYSEEKGEYISVGVYVETSELKHCLGIRPEENEKLVKALQEISSEDVIEYIENHGCYGVNIA